MGTAPHPSTSMPASGLLRQSRPSTSKAASSTPRISSPLATNSYSSSSVDSAGEGSEDDEDDSDADMTTDDSSDEEDDLETLLAAAKANARARSEAQSAAGPGLEDVNFADLAQEDNDTLPAVYTKPAIPSQVFKAAATSTTRDKGKQRAISQDGTSISKDDDDGEILPGVTSKWGELPRKPLTKSEKKKRNATSDKKNWFDLPYRSVGSLTNDEKREIQALRLSTVMDPKRFMRGEAKRENKKLPEHFQMGYIVESSQAPRAGFAAPSTKLQKDEKGLTWAKKKYAQVQEKGASGGKGHWKKRMNDRKSVGFGGAGKGKGRKKH